LTTSGARGGSSALEPPEDLCPEAASEDSGGFNDFWQSPPYDYTSEWRPPQVLSTHKLVSAPQAHPLHNKEAQDSIFWVPAEGSHSPKEGYQAPWAPSLGSLPRTGRSIRIALRGNLHASYDTSEIKKFL